MVFILHEGKHKHKQAVFICTPIPRTYYIGNMLRLLVTRNNLMGRRGAFAHVSTRSATTITSPNDKKLINLLARLDKFENESQIFDKLDELHLLSERKGFFNLNSNNLEFLSNNNKITNKMTNLYNFNDLNQLVHSQFLNPLMVNQMPVVAPNNINELRNSLKLKPQPRAGTNASLKTNLFQSNQYSFKPNVASIANAIPGLNAFSSPMSTGGSNKPVDSYINLLQGLAKNDVELKQKIEQILEAFDKEDDYFFNYVLEFWISGKSFNKIKAQKMQQKVGDGQLPSNLTMS